jgi:hypothetical protein
MSTGYTPGLGYLINISGINYYYNSYSTVVTPTTPKNVSCYTDSAYSDLLVVCTNSSGQVVQASFGFIVF